MRASEAGLSGATCWFALYFPTSTRIKTASILVFGMKLLPSVLALCRWRCLRLNVAFPEPWSRQQLSDEGQDGWPTHTARPVVVHAWRWCRAEKAGWTHRWR